jgi:hypothetical protein
MRRERVLAGLSAFAGIPVCAAAMLDRLVLFGRVEETGENPPWPIFETLLPKVLQALPYNAAFNDARLFDVAYRAAKVLPAVSVVAICDNWIGWLERTTAEGRLPSDHSLGVSDILISATRSEPSLRSRRVERLLAFSSTGPMIPFVADLIDVWDDLTADERTALLARLKTGRSDDRWLQAAALTRRDVPMVVQQSLLENELSLKDDPATLLSRIAPKLLASTVHVYIGDPQPLWRLGKHHSGASIWEAVIEQIARTPSNSLFDLAWEHIGSNGDGPRVASVVASLGPEHADRVLDILIRLKVGCAGNYMPEAWATLLELAADDQVRSIWIDRMAAFAPAILDDLSDLWSWLSQERDLHDMADRLAADFQPLEMMNIFSDSLELLESGDAKSKFVQLLELMLIQRPPHLLGTCGTLLEALERYKVDAPSLVETLRARREAIFEERKRMEEEVKLPDPQLQGWIRP